MLEPSPGAEAAVPAIPGDLWLEPTLAMNLTLPEFSTPQRKQLLCFLLYLSKRGFLPCKKASQPYLHFWESQRWAGASQGLYTLGLPMACLL